MLEKYVSKGSKKLRCGFTTGTCAAAASAGAARMLLSGKVIENITVITPSGNSVTVGLTDIKKENDYDVDIDISQRDDYTLVVVKRDLKPITPGLNYIADKVFNIEASRVVYND